MKHTGKPYEVIERTLDRDFFQTAQEAKDFGIVDRVVSSRDDEEVSAAAA